MRQLNTCRLCTKSTVKRNSKRLFEEHSLVTQIQNITGILLKNVRPLPQHICKVCLEDLEKAHDFRIRCISSQEYFNSVAYSGPKDISGRSEIQNEMPISDEFNNEPDAPENIGIPEIDETEYELPIDEKSHQGSFSPKSESENVLRADHGLSDKAESSSSSCYYSDKLHGNIEVDTQEKSLEATEIEQQELSNKSEKVIFVCDQCGISFPYRSHFVSHQRRHTGEKVFHCEICPQKFFENWQLQVHLRKHKGEKPFACEICGLRFSLNNDRKLHVRRRHTNERPYVCSQCSKGFAVSGMLKRHMLTHTGEKTFRCDVCNIWFGRKTNLVKHYRSLSHKQSEAKVAAKLE